MLTKAGLALLVDRSADLEAQIPAEINKFAPRYCSVRCWLLLVLSVVFLQAQEHNKGDAASSPKDGRIHGSVTDVEGRPIAGTTICLLNTGTGDRLEQTTTDEGRYAFKGLRAGSYEICSSRSIVQPASRLFTLVESQHLRLDLKLSDFAPVMVVPRVKPRTFEAPKFTAPKQAPKADVKTSVIEDFIYLPPTHPKAAAPSSRPIPRGEDFVATPCSNWEPAIRDQCVLAYSEFFRNETLVMKHQQRTYEFQLFSTKLILFMAVALLSCGISSAALQFWLALKPVSKIEDSPVASDRPKRSEPSNARLLNAEGETLPTKDASPLKQLSSFHPETAFASEMELSASGFKIKSSVLGLLLLVVSMDFFYLYINYVYPVQVRDVAPRSAKAPDAGTKQ